MNSKAKGIIDLSKMKYTSEALSEAVVIDHLRLAVSPKSLDLDDLDAQMGGSDFKMSGTISEYFAYVFEEEGQLVGNFDFSSNYLDLDALMNVYPEEETAEPVANTDTRKAASVEPAGPTLVPANIDFALNTTINKVKYNGIEAKNVRGKTSIKEEVAKLDDFSMNAMGGVIGLEGSYNNARP